MRTPLLVAPCLLIACSEYDLQSHGSAPADEPPEQEQEVPEEADPEPLPAIEVVPDALDFGPLPLECRSPRQQLHVFNVGDADLDVQEIVLASNDHAAYRMLATPTVLAPGDSLEVEVDFSPPDYGPFDTTTVQIVSDADNAPVLDVPLAGAGDDEGMILEHFTQNDIMPVDVLWVVDNSCSMGDKIDALVGEFEVFIDSFVALGLDYQLGVVSTDMDDPEHSGLLQGPIITSAHPDPVSAFVATASLGTDGSPDERPLDAAYAALTSPLIDGPNLGMVRPDTHLSVIVVTDEEDGSDISANAFSSWLNAYQGAASRASLSAMMGPKTGLLPCFGGLSGGTADPAPKLWNAVQQTGGIHVPICSMDMSAMLPQLAAASAGLMLTFPLTHPVTDPYQLMVQVDGNNVPYGATNGFTFDAANNAIEFHGAAVPPPTSTVSVMYPAELVCPY